jgi:hypothetical protein
MFSFLLALAALGAGYFYGLKHYLIPRTSFDIVVALLFLISLICAGVFVLFEFYPKADRRIKEISYGKAIILIISLYLIMLILVWAVNKVILPFCTNKVFSLIVSLLLVYLGLMAFNFFESYYNYFVRLGVTQSNQPKPPI